MTTLNFKTFEQNGVTKSNYSGICQVQGKLLNTPTWNAERNSNLATIACPDIPFQYTDQETGELVEAVIPAGNHTIGGSNQQYKSEIHVEGANVTFNMTYTPGYATAVFNFAPFVGVRGEMPRITIVSRTVVDTLAVSAAEV